MPRWAEALRSEIKKHWDLLTKLEEKQHKNDSRKKASAHQFIFEFGIKGVQRVLNKHSKATAMSEVYWECPIGFRWVWSEDTPPANRMKTQDVFPSLQQQMIKTRKKYTVVIDSEGIAVSNRNDTSPRRSTDHFCPHVECNGHDPKHFRSNRSAARDTTFLEEAGIFSYRTIGREERLGYPVATFREFNLFINRMANRKASGDDKMPADLFKKAPEIFRRWAMTTVNLILTGHYKCKPADFEARVILICKDASNPELFSNYRPIALCNAFYQLVNIVITSRLKELVEHYSVLESSQFRFRNS